MSLRRLAAIGTAALAATVALATALPARAATRAATPAATRAATAQLPVSYDFMANAIRYGADTSAPGENIWTCRPSRAHPEPVVLVPGTGGNAATNWGTYAALLHDTGYCVYALTYGVAPQEAGFPFKFGGMNSMERSALELQKFVARVMQATGAVKVALVGHSQGTLMPDYYVKFLGGARYVDKYISLAPLWHGVGHGIFGEEWWALARALGDSNDTQMPICGACEEMVAGSAFLQKLTRGGVVVKGVTYTNIITDHDELVLPYTSGIQVGMTNVVLQDRCPEDLTDHVEIASDPVASVYVLNALDPAHRRPVPCEPVLPAVGPPAAP